SRGLLPSAMTFVHYLPLLARRQSDETESTSVDLPPRNRERLLRGRAALFHGAYAGANQGWRSGPWRSPRHPRTSQFLETAQAAAQARIALATGTAAGRGLTHVPHQDGGIPGAGGEPAAVGR